ncbi:MAG: peptide ABC transporter substrate-binding protein [Leptolinea sp.]|nr:peptide ABC transporter substrate-binding protein [Leptolinea sp.]
MNKKVVSSSFAVLVIFSLLLTAFMSAAAPAPTTVLSKAAAAAFEPMKVAAANCDYGGEFKSIEAVDESTVKFTLCYPDPAFPSKVAFSVFGIQDKDYLDANKGDSVVLGEKANGTGAYKLVEWKKGDSIIYEANPDYWGTKAKVKNLVFKWSDQSAQRFLELNSGTVDGIDNPAPEDIETLKGDSNFTVYDRTALNIFYVGFNVNLKPFDNEKVRQAFAQAIDRQRIVDEYYPAGSTVAQNFVPDLFNPGFSKDIKWYDYNKDTAKKMLEDAKFDFNQEITLAFRNVVRGYLPSPDKVAQEIQGQLAEIGVKIKLKEMESATFIDDTSAGKEPFYLLGWGADYPDSTNFYDYHFANDNNKQFGKLFPDIVEPIKKAGQLSDAAERQKLYDKVNELLKVHVPMIPVAHGGSATVFKADVKNAHASPLTNEIFAVMDNGKDQLVWMQNGEPAALWCSDETDGETLRGCEAMFESLLAYKVGGVEVEPSLAEKYTVNKDATEYVFNLRKGVKFHNGATLDANDVVASFAAQWDAASPNHKGRTGTFEYFGSFFGSFLNAPKK